MRETLRRKFRMPDGDLFEILNAPDCGSCRRPEVEARNAKRLAAHFAVPAVKSPKIQIR